MQRIAVIDYGMGNLRSVSKALEHVAPDDEIVVSDNQAIIESADRVVCPGQGAAADCMRALHNHSLAEVVTGLIGSRPFLGICMGYQVLFDHSEENNGIDCLGVVPGQVKRFAQPLLADNAERLKVPHMGWSEVEHAAQHSLWSGIENRARFYFAHSYYCEPANRDCVTGVCTYGQSFAVSVAQSNLFACQFHPEKSARDGLQLLKNFANWNGD